MKTLIQFFTGQRVRSSAQRKILNYRTAPFFDPFSAADGIG